MQRRFRNHYLWREVSTINSLLWASGACPLLRALRAWQPSPLPAKNKTNSLVAKIEMLKQQNVSGSVVCFLVYRFCHVADMFASFLQKIVKEIASYIHYHENLNKAKSRPDEINAICPSPHLKRARPTEGGPNDQWRLRQRLLESTYWNIVLCF